MTSPFRSRCCSSIGPGLVAGALLAAAIPAARAVRTPPAAVLAAE